MSVVWVGKVADAAREMPAGWNEESREIEVCSTMGSLIASMEHLFFFLYQSFPRF